MSENGAMRTITHNITSQIEYQGVTYIIESEQSETATENLYTKLKRLMLKHINDDMENE